MQCQHPPGFVAELWCRADLDPIHTRLITLPPVKTFRIVGPGSPPEQPSASKLSGLCIEAPPPRLYEMRSSLLKNPAVQRERQLQ